MEKLKKYYPKFEDTRLTKEKLFYQILPNGKYSNRRINNLLSEGYLAAERFLIFQRLDRNSHLQKDLLTQEFQKRQLEDWFFTDANLEVERIENKPIKDWEDHLDLYQLYRRIYHYPNQNIRMRLGNQVIQKMDTEIDTLYLLEKAAIINEKIFRNQILLNEKHAIESALKHWQLLSQHNPHPSIQLYKIRFLDVQTADDRLAQYSKLKQAFLQSFGALNEKEKKVHLISLLNDITLLVKMGLLEITESLPLWKLGLKTDILLSEDRLTYNTYVTVVAISNTKRDFEFTESFIATYSAKLDQKVQPDALNWALAHTAYRKQKHEESLDFLLQHDFKQMYFLLMSKVLTAQVYFDLFLRNDSYKSYLFNFFDSFEKWINREGLWSKMNKTAFLRFIQKSRALARAYSDVNFSEEKLVHILDSPDNIQALNWLHQKQSEIMALKNKGRSY